MNAGRVCERCGSRWANPACPLCRDHLGDHRDEPHDWLTVGVRWLIVLVLLYFTVHELARWWS